MVSINPGDYENRVLIELFSRNGLSANLKVGLFENFTFADREFDCVILSQVLEHIKNPRTLLIEIARILRPGGVVAIAVPNFNSLFVKVLGARERSCLWVPEHCNYFTETALHILVRSSNLKLCEVTHVAKIPYFALSNRFGFQQGTFIRQLLNSLVQGVQYAPCKLMEHLGTGNYLNVFFMKSSEHSI